MVRTAPAPPGTEGEKLGQGSVFLPPFPFWTLPVLWDSAAPRLSSTHPRGPSQHVDLILAQLCDCLSTLQDLFPAPSNSRSFFKGLYSTNSHVVSGEAWHQPASMCPLLSRELL